MSQFAASRSALLEKLESLGTFLEQPAVSAPGAPPEPQDQHPAPELLEETAGESSYRLWRAPSLAEISRMERAKSAGKSTVSNEDAK